MLAVLGALVANGVITILKFWAAAKSDEESRAKSGYDILGDSGNKREKEDRSLVLSSRFFVREKARFEA